MEHETYDTSENFLDPPASCKKIEPCCLDKNKTNVYKPDELFYSVLLTVCLFSIRLQLFVSYIRMNEL